MTESQLKQKVKNQFKSHAHVQSIETTTGNGVPDLNICMSRFDFWVELKVDTGKGTLLRKEQRVWMYERMKQGGTCFVLSYNIECGLVVIYSGVSRIMVNNKKTVVPISCEKYSKYFKVTEQQFMVCKLNELYETFNQLLNN